MATVWLLAAASSGAALAQHVTGGMGEEVRMGAFDGRGGIDSHSVRIGQGSPASGKGKAHARATGPHGAPAAVPRGSVPTLPGRHLP